MAFFTLFIRIEKQYFKLPKFITLSIIKILFIFKYITSMTRSVQTNNTFASNNHKGDKRKI